LLLRVSDAIACIDAAEKLKYWRSLDRVV